MQVPDPGVIELLGQFPIKGILDPLPHSPRFGSKLIFQQNFDARAAETFFGPNVDLG